MKKSSEKRDSLHKAISWSIMGIGAILQAIVSSGPDAMQLFPHSQVVGKAVFAAGVMLQIAKYWEINNSKTDSEGNLE